MMPLCIFLVLLIQICPVPAVGKTSGITQDSGVIEAKVGETVTLKCSCQGDSVTFLSWYQQSLGGKPLIISTRMRHNTEASISPGYQDRFKVSASGQDDINHLIIKDLRLSDSATYYCGILDFNAIEFGQGAFLHVRASPSNIQAVVHQPALEPLGLGESVNLSCTVYAEPCAGEQSLYWFRHGAAQPAVMYASGGQCENITNEGYLVKKCTLNLALKSVSSPDAGVYYCALASCGETVFGSGTKVELVAPPLLVYCLIVALALSVIVLLVLASIVHKLKKKLCSHCKGTVSHLTCSAASENMSQDADSLHYAALNLNRTSEQHHQEDNVESVCVYSRVKSRKE
ncbi:uncharacterized protein LOC121962319 [Plectropomus leopardus]|uniref:uncharacterized protein LOC121962319 n=1 Tax=Plectropomus leopardus TaxID=160734 RepID=UPI001C4DAADB|nr:uncharacterized protein LOC121962319 [Plectropomus leopardus]